MTSQLYCLSTDHERQQLIMLQKLLVELELATARLKPFKTASGTRTEWCWPTFFVSDQGVSQPVSTGSVLIILTSYFSSHILHFLIFMWPCLPSPKSLYKVHYSRGKKSTRKRRHGRLYKIYGSYNKSIQNDKNQHNCLAHHQERLLLFILTTQEVAHR